jgi:sporulation protein YlmC with PRC-barrel domain
MMKAMKWILVAAIAALPWFAATVADAQVAGTQPIGVSVEQTNLMLNGWSAKKSLLGRPVYNDQGERVGVLHDIIITPDDAVSFAIVSAHQFLGVSQHDIAVPIVRIDIAGGKLVWAGATRDAIKAMPVFQYSKMRTAPIARKDFAHH